jgi:hypothetical protein
MAATGVTVNQAQMTIEGPAVLQKMMQMRKLLMSAAGHGDVEPGQGLELA